MKIPVYTLDPDASFKILAGEIKSFVQELEQPAIPLLGLGVPGLVDAEHRVIRSAAESGWHNVDVGGLMKNETGWTTVVINRHRARGLAECRYAPDQQYHNMIYIGVGSGIAAGLYINRQLLSGAKGGAGEIGLPSNRTVRYALAVTADACRCYRQDPQSNRNIEN